MKHEKFQNLKIMIIINPMYGIMWQITTKIQVNWNTVLSYH